MHALVSVGTAGVDWVPWVVAGAAANITTAHGIGTKEQRALNPVVSTILMVLAIGLSLIPWRAVEADRRALEARFASNGGQGSAAIARAEAAISLDDGRADYWNELGRALFVGSRWHEAADAFRTSVARAPYDATYRINLARALTQMARAGDSSMGGKSAALAAALEAVESDPNEPTIRGAQAEIANALGEHEIALRAAVSAIRLYPREPSYDSLAALAASQLSDTSLVRQLVGQALGYKDSAILRVVVAQAALRQGDRPAALENARQALRLDPSSQDAKAIIAAAGG
jgi:tetratricopeptide (TPR) repeat protein